jgi:hypothetical protein
MTARKNPFEYLGANDLPESMILDYYIEDFNYSRFIQSKRNILLVGERGCGKSMTLLYNSWQLQRLKAERENRPLPLELIGIYIPCNTPLTHKREFQLLDELPASILSEHHLVLSLVFSIAQTLASIPGVMEGADEAKLRSRIEFIFDAELPNNVPFFDAIMDFVNKENLRTQRSVNDRKSPSVEYDNTFSFSSLVVPMLGCTRFIPRLQESHFMLLVDDAHDLNAHQIRALNSWIAYREHSLFSFKVAIASVPKTSLKTASGGSILEGHDFTRLDMVQPFHNEASNFGKLAHRLVQRRLEKFNISSTPEDFFPISTKLQQDMEEAETAVRQEAVTRFGENSRKISDYVYKYKRAYYFRSRSPRANRPEYSGFDTLVYLSTGVIRNLLYPCYWMFDKMMSLETDNPASQNATRQIPPNIQDEIIIERSRALWDWIREELDQSVEGCSREDALRCYQLLDNLAIHFRERLLRHKSEPRANSFTLSGQTPELMEKLNRLFRILRHSQLLYVRSGSAKDKGKRELYYVPNRMLWPERGLDPHGQHARVSLSASELWDAANDNRQIEMRDQDEKQDQPRLFNE